MAYSEHPSLRDGGLEVRSESRGTTHILVLRGELDADGCPGLESQLVRIESNGAQRIVLDLSEVEFIDSSGIGLLVAAMRRSEADSDRLRFVPSFSEDVQRLLELCGLEGRLPLTEEPQQ
jgi:anti-sigma B factor antagonist